MKTYSKNIFQFKRLKIVDFFSAFLRNICIPNKKKFKGVNKFQLFYLLLLQKNILHTILLNLELKDLICHVYCLEIAYGGLNCELIYLYKIFSQVYL